MNEALFLQRSGSTGSSRIQHVDVSGRFHLDLSEFQLERGMLGTTEIVWGEGSVANAKAVLVGSPNHRGELTMSIVDERGTITNFERVKDSIENDPETPANV